MAPVISFFFFPFLCTGKFNCTSILYSPCSVSSLARFKNITIQRKIKNNYKTNKQNYAPLNFVPLCNKHMQRA